MSIIDFAQFNDKIYSSPEAEAEPDIVCGPDGCNDWTPQDTKFWCAIWMSHLDLEDGPIGPETGFYDFDMYGPPPPRQQYGRQCHWLAYLLDNEHLPFIMQMETRKEVEEFLKKSGIAPGQPFRVRMSFWSGTSYEGEYDEEVDWDFDQLEPWDETRIACAWAEWNDPNWSEDTSTLDRTSPLDEPF